MVSFSEITTLIPYLQARYSFWAAHNGKVSSRDGMTISIFAATNICSKNLQRSGSLCGGTLTNSPARNFPALSPVISEATGISPLSLIAFTNQLTTGLPAASINIFLFIGNNSFRNYIAQGRVKPYRPNLLLFLKTSKNLPATISIISGVFRVELGRFKPV